MSYIHIYPTSEDAENSLLIVIEAIQLILRTCVREIWEVPENDIIVMAHRNTVLAQDPIAEKAGAVPDLIIKINTSDTKLQHRAEQLRDRIVKAWKILFGTTHPMEVWIGFFHTWGCTIDFA